MVSISSTLVRLFSLQLCTLQPALPQTSFYQASIKLQRIERRPKELAT